MSTKWLVYCMDNEDRGWHSVWSNETPTTCPNNVLHEINTSSPRMVSKETEVLRISNINSTIRTNKLSRVIVFQYVYNRLLLKRARIVASVSGIGTTSYTVELLNLTTNETLLSSTVTELSESIIDIGLISNAPTTNCLLEVSVKRNDGLGKIVINEIVLYAEYNLDFEGLISILKE